MRQLIHQLDSGAVCWLDCPDPQPGPGQVIVRAACSVISSGTEGALVRFGRANLLMKARQQPERVREVLTRARVEGIAATADAVRGRLAMPLSLGYALAGEVVAVGVGVVDLEVGDRVACNGPHAELSRAQAMLCVKLPPGLDDERACFATLAAIALEPLRLAQVSLGASVVIVGAGLLGALAVQLAIASGAQVLVVDPDARARERAQALGAWEALAPDDPTLDDRARTLTDGRGADAALIFTEASASALALGARLCRQGGHLVLIGGGEVRLPRRLMYERGLVFHVSRSYGPGRDDPAYEGGADYPIAHARWTAQRNMQAAIALMARGQLDVAPLIAARLPHLQAPDAYGALITRGAVVLRYAQHDPVGTRPQAAPVAASRPRRARAARQSDDALRVGIIGAGLYASRTLLPALAALGPQAQVSVIAAPGGLSAALAARAFGAQATSDAGAVCDDDALDAVLILTRHDSHAQLATRALSAGKHVFVEKPVAITHEQLDTLQQCAQDRPDQVLAAGYNRRFASLVRLMSDQLDKLDAPRHIQVIMSGGPLPESHWSLDEAQGGRLLGEGCHAIDLALALAPGALQELTVTRLPGAPCRRAWEGATALMRFEGGHVATAHYLGNGPRQLQKDRVEVLCAGHALRLEGFRTLSAPGLMRPRTLWRPDKGHEAMLRAFIDAARGVRAHPVSPEQLWASARAALTFAKRDP